MVFSHTFTSDQLVFVACGDNCKVISMYLRDHLSRSSLAFTAYTNHSPAEHRYEFHEKNFGIYTCQQLQILTDHKKNSKCPSKLKENVTVLDNLFLSVNELRSTFFWSLGPFIAWFPWNIKQFLEASTS